MAKIRNFDSFGAVFPHFCPDERESWHGGADLRGNVSPLRGEKPIFGPVSKNNTGMAALLAGLPVIKDCARRFVLLKLTTDRHEASRGFFATAELLVLYTLLSFNYSNSSTGLQVYVQDTLTLWCSPLAY